MSEVMIKGPQDRINWLMVAAFRYCVGRHTTQAMYGVTVPPDKFEAEHIGVSNRQEVQK